MSKPKKRLRSERLEELFAELQAASPEPPTGLAEEATAPVVRFQCDGQGRLVAFDDALAQILGYTEDELRHLALTELIPDLEGHPLYRPTIEGTQEMAGVEVQVRDARGVGRPAALYLTASANQETEALLGILQFQHSAPSVTAPTRPGTRFLSSIAAQERLQGLLLQGERLAPARKPLTPAGEQALRQKAPVAQPAQAGQPAALAAPVPLPDATGLLEVVDPSPGRVWDEDERQLAAEIAQQLALTLENARLFQAAQRRAAELQALLNLTRAVAQQLKLEDVYAATDQALQQLMPAESLLIGLIDEERDIIDLVYARDRGKMAPPGIQVPLRQGLSGYVVQQNRPVLVKDFDHADELPFRPLTIRTRGDEKRTRSAVAAPLRIGERIIGILSVQSYTPNAYTPADLHLLTGVADQVALAIQNARLFAQTQEALHTTAQLYRLTAAFNAASTYEEILQTLRDFLGSEVHTVVISLFDHPWDDDNPPEWMSPVAYISDLDIPPHLATRRYRVSDFSEVQRIRGEGDFIPDTSHHDWHEATRQLYAEALQARAAAFVPLVVGGRWIGFLNLLYRQPHAFPPEERQQIVAVSSQAAVAVENLRALENIRRQAADLEALNRLAQTLGRTLDLQEVFHTALAGAQEILQVDAGLISFAPEGNVATLQLAAAFNLPPEVENLLRTRGIDITTTACGHTFTQTEPFILPNLDQSREPFAVRLKDWGFRAYVGIPLRYGGHTLGTICLFRKGTYHPRPGEVALLQSIAQEVAAALTNARLYQQAQEALAETERLYQIGRALSQARSYDEVLEVLRTQTPLSTHAHNMSLNFFNRPWTDPEDIPEWSIVAARWTRLAGERLAPRYPLRQFPAARWLSATEPFIVEDIASDPRLDDRTRQLYQVRFQAQSTAFFPLVVGGRWIGYINAIYGKRRSFSEEDLRYLQGAIAQAAIALENLILLEQSKRRAEAERTVREITAEIFKASSTADALQTAARMLTQAVGVSHAQIHLLRFVPRRSFPNLTQRKNDERE